METLLTLEIIKSMGPGYRLALAVYQPILKQRKVFVRAVLGR